MEQSSIVLRVDREAAGVYVRIAKAKRHAEMEADMARICQDLRAARPGLCPCIHWTSMSWLQAEHGIMLRHLQDFQTKLGESCCQEAGRTF